MRDFQRDLEILINEGVIAAKDKKIRFIMKHSDRMNGDIKLLDLNDRAYNRMAQNGIRTLEKLYNRFDDIQNIRGAGVKVVKEVKTAYISYYYDQLNDEERKEFWRDTINATIKM